MGTNSNSSKRVFAVTGFEGLTYFVLTLTLSDLVKGSEDNDSEVLYTLQESIDEILDLKVGETFLSRSSIDSNTINTILIRLA